MTTKQTKTLVLFAMNYSLRTIAKIQGVNEKTIRERIKLLSENHSREFNNALGIRNAYEKSKGTIRNIKTLSNLTLGELDEAGEIKRLF